MPLGLSKLPHLGWSSEPGVCVGCELCAGPLRPATPRSPAALLTRDSPRWCSQPEVRDWHPGARALGSSGRTSEAQLSLPFLYHHRGWGRPLHISGPVPVLVWLLLYIHSYRTSVQLVFRAFSVTAALWFGCNFDVVVGGGEHSVHRLCRLAWKSRVRTDLPAFVERMYD